MMLVTTFLPVVANNLPPIIGSFHLYGPIFISLLLTTTNIFFQKNIFYTLIIGLLICYIFPVTIWWSIDDWNLRSIRREFYEIFSALLVYYYLYNSKAYKAMAIFVKLTLLFLVVTMFLTYYSASIDPMYARMLTGDWYKDDIKTRVFQKLGGGTYSTAISIMALLPMGVYFYKNNSIINVNRITIALYGLLIIVSLIKMQIFGNLLVGIIVLFLSIQSGKKIVRSLFIISIGFIISLLIPNYYYSILLTDLSQYFDPSTEINFKLTDMANYLLTGDDSTAAGYRAARFPELITAFLNSPFFGASFKGNEAYNIEGGHLYWMNKIAVMGIIGFIIFVQIFYKNISYYLKTIDNSEFKLFYLLSVSSILIYGLIKNIAGREAYFTLFFILPSMQYLPLLKKQKNEQ